MGKNKVATIKKPAAPGKIRKINQSKIKSSKSISNLLNLGKDLRSATLSSKPSVKKAMTNKEVTEVKKFQKLWNKTDRILRARSISTYKPMAQVCVRDGKKENLFLILLREHNVSFSNFVKSVQAQSPWIPNLILDTMCHSIQMAAFEVGWLDLLGNEDLVIDQGYQKQIKEKVWKQMPFKGPLKKLERFRTALTSRSTSRKSEILLPMLQRAGTRILSNFKATTLNGDAPYDELSASDLANLTKYKKSFFAEIGRPCIALALFDAWFDSKCMKKLIDEMPDKPFQNAQQRALKKAAAEALKIHDSKFQKCPFYSDITQWVFPSAF